MNTTMNRSRTGARSQHHIVVPNRRSIATSIALLTIDMTGGGTVFAAELTGYINLTTDYTYRGVTRSDSHPAAQLGGDMSFDKGIYVGVWGSTIDIGNGVGRQRDLELSYYAGYSLPLSDRWTAGISAVAYRFPGARGDVDYDHEEYSLSLNYDDWVWFEYSQIPDYYNSGARTQNYELFAEWPLKNSMSFSAGIGHYDVAEYSGRAYTHWQLGMSRPFGRFGLDLRYHDTSRWVPRISNPDRAEARVVLSARFQF